MSRCVIKENKSGSVDYDKVWYYPECSYFLGSSKKYPNVDLMFAMTEKVMVIIALIQA